MLTHLQGCDRNVVTKLELLVMWSVALESKTHVKEDERKHVLVLPDSTSVEIGVEADLSDL